MIRSLNPTATATVLVVALLVPPILAHPLSILVANDCYETPGVCYNSSVGGVCTTNVPDYSCDGDTYCEVTYIGNAVHKVCKYESWVPQPVSFPPGGSCDGNCVMQIESAYLIVATESSQGWDMKCNYTDMTPCQKVYECKCDSDAIGCYALKAPKWASDFDIQESYSDGEGCGYGS